MPTISPCGLVVKTCLYLLFGDHSCWCETELELSLSNICDTAYDPTSEYTESKIEGSNPFKGVLFWLFESRIFIHYVAPTVILRIVLVTADKRGLQD